MDLLKEWWGIFVGFFMAAIWIGANQQKLKEVAKAQKNHELDHKNNPCVTKALCEERREEFEKHVNFQFNSGENQFKEIKTSLNDLRKDISGVKNDVIEAIMAIKR